MFIEVLSETLSILILVIIAIIIAVMVKMLYNPSNQNEKSEAAGEYKTYKIFNQKNIQKQQSDKLSDHQNHQSDQDDTFESNASNQGKTKNISQQCESEGGNNSIHQNLNCQPFNSKQNQENYTNKKSETLLLENAEITTTIIKYDNQSDIKDGEEIYFQELIQSRILFNPVMPKSVSPQQQISDSIFQLYDMSFRRREIETDVSQILSSVQNINELINCYAGIHRQLQQALKDKLIGFRRVRCDGNCYYTSFIFQYLSILLNQYDNKQFQAVIDEMEKMNFASFYQEFSIRQQLEKQLAFQLAAQLRKLRDTQDKEIGLQQLINDPNNYFYGLSIIYARNLAFDLVQKVSSSISAENGINFKEEILQWESECNSMELIHKVLAEQLNIIINVYLIDKQRGEFTYLTYGLNEQHQINLLLQPGHYEIGISA